MPEIPAAGAKSAYDKLLNAARVLFYSHGINGTGIDAIVKRAGVAKKSLYNNFASKDELIATYLTVRHQEWLDLYQQRAQKAVTPRDGVVAVFQAYGDHAEFAYEHGFRGCGLLNAAAELEAGAPGREAVRRHKEEVEAILAGHLMQIATDPARATNLARHFAFLLEGSISRAGLEGKSDCIAQACRMAEELMEAL
ncbi:TetR/AcrR family transcriptional regulator [Kalamiella sp. sgz302252]|uniref:TetR/AcrR family transcriptional regulator n=1 Tax=Pantoea sp. sgz302252 TaxID=3341827 RepID=UPI0036D34533